MAGSFGDRNKMKLSLFLGLSALSLAACSSDAVIETPAGGNQVAPPAASGAATSEVATSEVALTLGRNP